jgi:iron complex outermembrane receptor protein
LSAYAQSESCGFQLNGHIDFDSTKDFQSLSVVILNTGKGSRVSENGLFSISNLCAKSYLLQIKYFGTVLSQDTIVMKGDTTLNYQVKLKITEFGSVEILASKKDFSTSVKQVLTIDQLDKTKGLSLGAMLEEVNGIRTLKTGNSIAKPVIHGLHSNRVLILNNSIRQEGQQWGAEHAPEIDPFVSNSISVIKGASTIKYGFDAIGGVVLIEPQKVSDSAGMYGELNLIGFSNGRQGAISGSVNSRFKKIPALSISLQGSMKRGGNNHTPNYFLKNTGIKEYNFSSAVNWEKKNYGVNFFYSQFNTDLGIFSGSHIGNLTDLQNAFQQSEPVESSGFSYLIDRPRQHIEHELTKASFYLKTGTIGKLNFVYGRQYNLRYEYDKHKPLNDSLANLNNPELKLELTSHTVDVNWEHFIHNGFSGEIGVNSILQRNTYTGRMFIPNYANQGIGAYWIERKEIKKLLIEGGIRYDVRMLESYFWENDEIVSPRNNYGDWAMNLGMRYTFKPKNSISFNIAKTWRPPSVNELYSDGLHHGAAAVEIGDRQISKESALNSNLEIRLNHKKIDIIINPYFNYFENYIFLEPQLPPTLTIKGAFPTFVFKEARANIYGVDIHAGYQILKDLRYELNISIVRGDNRSISDYLIQMPSDNYRNKLDYTIPNFNIFQKNEISVRHSFVAEQTRIPANSDFAPPPNAYNVFDILFTTTIKSKHTPVKLTFGVNNLFNAVYRDYLNRFRYYADELGRNFSIRIKIPINGKQI